MRPPPGYVKVNNVIALANEGIALYPPEQIHQMVAEAAGQLLTEALLTQGVDTTMPIYVDGAQSTFPTSTSLFYNTTSLFYNITEIKVELLYAKRVDEHPSLTSGARAIGQS